MKVRLGFVSNSSSTSFTFIAKGNSLWDIYDMIAKYHVYFELFCEKFHDEDHNRQCNAYDVIHSIDNAVDYNGKKVMVQKIEDVISNMKKSLDSNIKYHNDNPFNDDDLQGAVLEALFETGRRIADIQDAQKYGFTNVLIIGFGDNHGEVSGTDVAIVMDYEGRNIHINKPDFIVYTEQNR